MCSPSHWNEWPSTHTTKLSPPTTGHISFRFPYIGELWCGGGSSIGSAEPFLQSTRKFLFNFLSFSVLGTSQRRVTSLPWALKFPDKLKKPSTKVPNGIPHRAVCSQHGDTHTHTHTQTLNRTDRLHIIFLHTHNRRLSNYLTERSRAEQFSCVVVMVNRRLKSQ